MSNQRSNQVGIQLKSVLNMTKKQTEIKQFEGFNANNTPYFGGCLSPLYEKTATSSSHAVVDSDGDIWDVNGNGYLTKNDTAVKQLDSAYTFKITDKGSSYDDYRLFADGTSASATMSDDEKTCHVVYYSTNTGSILSQYDLTVLSQYQFKHVSISKPNTAKVYKSYLCIVIDSVGSNNSRYSDFYLININTSQLMYSKTYNFISSENVFYTGWNTTIAEDYEYNSESVLYLAHTYILFKNVIQGLFSGSFLYGRNLHNGVCYVMDVATGDLKSIALADANFGVCIYMDEYGYFYGYYNRPVSNSYKLYSATTLKSISLNTDITPNTTWYIPTYNTHIERNVTITSGKVSETVDEAMYCFYPDECIVNISDNTTNSTVSMYASRYTTYIYQNGGYFIYNGARCCNVSDLSTGDPSNLSGLTYTGMRLIYNNGYVSGISFNCTLLTSWYSIDTNYVPVIMNNNGANTSSVLYKESFTGKFKIIQAVKNTPYILDMIFDRYIIFNTTSFNNCYDTVLGKFIHYADSWNGGIYYGLDETSSPGTIDLSITHTSSYFSFASGVNVNYEIYPYLFSSITLNPIVVSYSSSGIYGLSYKSDGDTTCKSREISVYYSTISGSYPVYHFGITGNSDFELEGVQYPVETTGNIIYNSSLFAKYITSYTRNDMVVEGTTAYPIIYYNASVPRAQYYLLSAAENVTGVFSIQGSYYVVDTDNINLVTYSSGVLNSYTSIVTIKGMTYLGATPYAAYFWSSQNRSMYIFGGDRLLNKAWEANKISEIYATSYNTKTYNLFVATDAGVYVFGDCMFCLPEFTDVAKITQTDDATVLMISTDSGGNFYEEVYISYVALTGYVKKKVSFETQFYGNGNNVLGAIDTWYVRLYNDGTAEPGTVTFSVKTLTNIGVQTETKTLAVRATDWDRLTGTYYARFQPRFQQSIGTSLAVTSDFPISDLSAGVTVGGTPQLGANNI